MNSKTVTPIISIILLVLLTIVASTTAYFWMTDLQEQIQSDTQGNLNNNQISDLTDFSILSANCNATDDYITLTIMNTGAGDIPAGTGVLVLTNSNGAELNTIINSSMTKIEEGTASYATFTLTYNMTASTNYLTKLTLSNSKTRTYSCTGQN